MAHIFAPKPWHRSKMLNSPGFAPTQSHFKIRSNVRHSSSCFGFHHHNYFPKKMCRKIGHIFSKFYSNVSPHLPKGGVNNEFTNIPTARLAISR